MTAGSHVLALLRFSGLPLGHVCKFYRDPLQLRTRDCGGSGAGPLAWWVHLWGDLDHPALPLGVGDGIWEAGTI